MPRPKFAAHLFGRGGPLKVHLSSHLRSYTRGRDTVEASGGTVDAVLKDLDRRFPGVRFRIIDEQDQLRAHMKIFVNEEMIERLSDKVKAADEVHIIGALSGG